jgi:hypothetical protein
MLRNRLELPQLDELYPPRQRDGDAERDEDLDDGYVPGFDDEEESDER